MADNTTMNLGSGGNTIRTLEDGSSIQWPAGVTAYATTVGTPDVLQIVTPTAGLPVQQQTGATFTVVGTGTFVAQVSGDALTSLQLIDDAVATAGSAITAKGMAAVGTDGTNARILKTDASGELQVDVLTMPTTTVTGTIAVTNDALTELGGVIVAGGASHTNGDVAMMIGAINVATEFAEQLQSTSGSLHIHDGGGSITVDGTVGISGTVTVDSHAVTNAGTFAVQAAQSGTWNITNISGTISLPTGAATAAKQPALGTAGTASADVITVQGIASMTALKVDGSAVTQPVSDGGSTLSVDDGGGSLTVDGSVSVSGLVPGTSATSLGKAEDAAAADGDTGVAVWAVRKDTAATTVGADGDYHPFEVDGNGRLWVNGSSVTQPVSDAGGSLTVDNGGTFAVQVDGAALTSLQLIDDTVFVRGTAGANTDKGIQLWATRNDAAAGYVDVADLDVSPISVDSGGRVGVCDLGGSITVDNAGTFVVQVDGTALTRLTDIETNTDSGAVVGNGAAATAQRVTISNDSTGILAGVTTVTTVTTCGTVTTLTGGGVAHDGADSGNPHLVGAHATSSIAGVTLVANADRTRLYAGLDGALIVRPECSLEDVVQERATNTDGASTAFASGLAAPGAGIRLWIKGVTISNSSASFCTVDLRDGSAGSVLWTLPVPATGGVTYKFDPPLKLTANTALAYDASAAITTLTISANGFRSKV